MNRGDNHLQRLSQTNLPSIATTRFLCPLSYVSCVACLCGHSSQRSSRSGRLSSRVKCAFVFFLNQQATSVIQRPPTLISYTHEPNPMIFHETVLEFELRKAHTVREEPEGSTSTKTKTIRSYFAQVYFGAQQCVIISKFCILANRLRTTSTSMRLYFTSRRFTSHRI